jgi:hypothetical protein
MPSYASFNVALSLCMIMSVIALLVGRSQSFASPHFVPSMSSTHASNSKNQVCHCVHYKFLCMVFVSHSKVNFHVLPFKNFQLLLIFVPLFLAHEDVVVGIAIFHIKLSTTRLGSFICSSLILHESW